MDDHFWSLSFSGLVPGERNVVAEEQQNHMQRWHVLQCCPRHWHTSYIAKASLAPASTYLSVLQ